MIEVASLRSFIEQELEGTDYFLTDLKVSPANEITVEIDSMGSVDIDFCIKLTRAIEGAFSRDDEDYELEVGSAGITSPFKVRKQYEKNIGRDIEVLSKDGKKYHGMLLTAGEDSFTFEIIEKVKEPGAKRPVEQKRAIEMAYSDAKSVKYDLKF